MLQGRSPCSPCAQLTRHLPSPFPHPQLGSLPPGPYLQQLEELHVSGNLTLHPSALPMQLLHQRRLRRLALPLWWRLVAADLQQLLLLLMPWLVLEHR